MRKTKLLTVILVAILLVGLAPTSPLLASDGPSTIRVTGAGAVATPPDFATVRLGVRTENNNAQLALLENNEIVNRIIQGAKDIGIEDDDIHTANFSIHGTFGTGANWNVITSHRVTNNVSIIVRDMELIGAVLGAAVEAGANISTGIAFGITDSTAAYNQALALASRDAQTKAQTIASALDVRIVGVVSVFESHGTHMPVARATVGDGNIPGPFFAPGAPAATAEANWGVPIEVADLSVTANVEIIFEIAP